MLLISLKQTKTKDVQREQLAEQQQLENILADFAAENDTESMLAMRLMVMTKKKPIDCSIMRLRPLRHAPKKQKSN